MPMLLYIEQIVPIKSEDGGNAKKKMSEIIISPEDCIHSRYHIELDVSDLDRTTFGIKSTEGVIYASQNVSFVYELNPFLHHLLQLLPPTYNDICGLIFDLGNLFELDTYREAVAEFVKITNMETITTVLNFPIGHSCDYKMLNFKLLVNSDMPLPQPKLELVKLAWDRLVELDEDGDFDIDIMRPTQFLQSPIPIAQTKEKKIDIWFSTDHVAKNSVQFADINKPCDEVEGGYKITTCNIPYNQVRYIL
ncbi:CUN062 hypothetical protein [Culex nigripalpus nucleopolyhedrovirus]|uniref:Uncharacterized protein n=1 Tax=Culex nigripalpus nucleopolyhedrovirus (isolate Florida/1997) TaxID=645993 RepID=Q919L4_NPVCO|nr:CUN062 hypothetical protein [Culex nigripalpus nucleopolyhedrovirus]AAK94140.1 CUN062 hypothetical protein [Culex nigripalpus nucleopolyhedrovirus]